MGVLAGGCDRDEKIRPYTIRHETPRATDEMPAGHPNTSQIPALTTGQPAPPTPVAGAGSGATWTAPADWEAEPQQSMRIASWHAGKCEVIISKFAQNNIGDLLANINRWRRMVGLPDLAD